jgi:hypothetical protein
MRELLQVIASLSRHETQPLSKVRQIQPVAAISINKETGFAGMMMR